MASGQSRTRGRMAGQNMATQAEETRFQLQKARMLKAAARCFNLKGYSGTSLRDVADELDLTDAALYYYVRNKEELVYLCYVRAADLGREALDKAQAECENGMDIILRYLRYHVEMMVGDRGPIAIMSETCDEERRSRGRGKWERCRGYGTGPGGLRRGPGGRTDANPADDCRSHGEIDERDTSRLVGH